MPSDPMTDPTRDAFDYWRTQLTGPRHVDPDLPWRDADVMVVVADLVKAHEAALATPDPAPAHPDDGHEHWYACIRCGVDNGLNAQGGGLDVETLIAAMDAVDLVTTRDRYEGIVREYARLRDTPSQEKETK